VALFDRLPEIYRTRDTEQSPPDQLRAFLRAIEIPFDELYAHITQLYDNLFIDTCEDWVIPYLGDLLGTTHLKGDPRTLRADVADTIALRRRKGTLGAIERLAVNLTAWACRCVELRENLAWTQHLNHQRPDTGGDDPSQSAETRTRFDVPRGGTVPLRDPAALALLGTPFDSFAYTADVKAAIPDARHVNLPNLAIFLWRLVDYRLPLTVPLAKGAIDLGPQPAGLATFSVRFDLHPLDLPVRLFNTSRPGFRSGAAGGGIAPLTGPDAVPDPIRDARLTSGLPAAHPEAYVQLDFYDDAVVPPTGFTVSDVGLHLSLPQRLEPLLVPAEPHAEWRWLYRGDNLCAWESGLRRPLRYGEIVIDPDLGRIAIGMNHRDQVKALVTAEGGRLVPQIYTGFTYAAPGPVGAHPVQRDVAVDDALEIELRRVGGLAGGTLQAALEHLDTGSVPVVIQIDDSLVHPVDISALPGTSADGGITLRLARSLTIRAAAEHRPVVLLAQPLAFRPVAAADATTDTPVVRLEGLYLAADGTSLPPTGPLIGRAAVARLEVLGCTLSPGGYRRRDGTRAPTQVAMRLENGFGFSRSADVGAFVPTPDIIIQRSVTGPLAADDGYRLDITDSIVDAGLGVDATPDGRFAIAAAAGDRSRAWGARLDFSGLTCFGPVRVSGIGGQGGIFTQRVVVLDNQHGCVKWSWFSGRRDRLPPNHFCLRAPGARLVFTSESFNDSGYAQLANESDARIRTLGPNDDAMGAFGFLLDAHKSTNLQIRLREFMPVGVRPLIVPVT
jgi:hypothetical protein